MLLRLLFLLVILLLSFDDGNCADIALARGNDGSKIPGIAIEGEIIPGDALKLLGMYEYYGTSVSRVFLLSNGGDVNEAMSIGRLIRVLNMETIVPDHLGLPAPISIALAQNGRNVVCASACFLIYEGGVRRIGDFLVLHRPYLSTRAANSLADTEQEAVQRKLMNNVQAYLKYMGTAPYYIDRMMSTSSQDGYVVTFSDIMHHPLPSVIPSLEEVMLSKCKVVNLTQVLNAQQDTTPDAVRKRAELLKEYQDGQDCMDLHLGLIQEEAWNNERAVVADDNCKRLQLSSRDQQELMQFYNRPTSERTHLSDAEQTTMPAMFQKVEAFSKCKGDALLTLGSAALHRWREAAPGATLPPDYQANPFELIELTQRRSDR